MHIGIHVDKFDRFDRLADYVRHMTFDIADINIHLCISHTVHTVTITLIHRTIAALHIAHARCYKAHKCT